MERAEGSVHPRRISPSGFIDQALFTLSAIVAGSFIRAARAAETPSFVEVPHDIDDEWRRKGSSPR